MSQVSIQLDPVAGSSRAEPESLDDSAVQRTPTPSALSVAPDGDDGSRQAFPAASEPDLTESATLAVIASVTCITVLSSYVSGVLVVAIPTIAKDINLPETLILWPSSIYSLVCGCTLLLAGSIADVVGSRLMYLLGSFLQFVFTLACGLSKTGTELIVFRGFSGLAISFCLPSAVSIITNTFPPGRRRNVAFSCMGGGQPIGFAVGITLGGVFVDKTGWRWGFYMASIFNAVVFLIAIRELPKTPSDITPVSWQRVSSDIDWIGALIASTSLGMLSYVFASITSSTSTIKSSTTLSLLCTAIALIPAFIFWMHRQERLSRPALIPNSLWRNRTFTTICLCVFLTWGTFNTLEQIITFFFQYVQQVTPLQSSLRLLPAPLSGFLANLIIALIVHRLRADWIITTASFIALLPPLLLAINNPNWSYWYCSFAAVFLNPIGADALFTISNLLITSVFPARMQGLAGGVFNTLSRVGASVGLALSAVVADTVTSKAAGNDLHQIGGGIGAANGTVADPHSREALLQGYRATFWFCLALNAATLFLSAWGLRSIGKVGVKRD